MSECAEILEAADTDDPVAILGGVDAVKLRFSMTLFMRAAPGPSVFARVLDRFFSSRADEATEGQLG